VLEAHPNINRLYHHASLVGVHTGTLTIATRYCPTLIHQGYSHSSHLDRVIGPSIVGKHLNRRKDTVTI
jgi:hypothetical protein